MWPYFHHHLGKWSNLTNIFSKGFKPPTSQMFVVESQVVAWPFTTVMWLFLFGEYTYKVFKVWLANEVQTLEGCIFLFKDTWLSEPEARIIYEDVKDVRLLCQSVRVLEFFWLEFWAPPCHNPYKWPYKYHIYLINGSLQAYNPYRWGYVTTLLITGRGPPCRWCFKRICRYFHPLAGEVWFNLT